MIEAGTAQTISINETEYIHSLLVNHLQEGHSISIWRQPESTKKNLIICTGGVRKIDEVTIEELPTGFVLAPFNSEDKKLFLKADISYCIDDGEVRSSIPLNANLSDNSTFEGNKNTEIPFHSKKLTTSENTVESDYLELVKKSIQQIEKGHLEKIVPARSKKIILPKGFNLLQAFSNLCALYPNAFVSLVSTPETGTWMGASPELLASVDDQMHFKTVAVAGTQALHPDVDIKSIVWTQKEIEEQALVSRYIINCFKRIRLREYEEHGPKTWRAGNLLHLKTDYEVDMIATNFPQLGTVMLKLLHPTSAVCGMPREEALSFLKANEQFDRQYYAGFLGPINFENESNLYVNLRCMQWSGHEAMLFAGAGVTTDSNPQKEWEETEMKMNTLLNVITP